MVTYLYYVCNGDIQQLYGLSFTQFWPPLPLEWTNVEILNDTYTLCHVTKCGLSTDLLPPLLVQVVIEWPFSSKIPSIFPKDLKLTKWDRSNMLEG